MLFSRFTLIALIAVFLKNFGYGNIPKHKQYTLDLAVHNRFALVEEEYEDVLKAWFLHNGYKDTWGISEDEQTIRSQTWIALSRLNICPENMPADKQGAVIWPIALFNMAAKYSHRSHLLSSIRTGKNPIKNGIANLATTGKHIVDVHLDSVLHADMIPQLTFNPKLPCGAMDAAIRFNENESFEVNKTLKALSLYKLLKVFQDNFNREYYPNVSAVEARIFDIIFYLKNVEKRKLSKLDKDYIRKIVPVKTILSKALNWTPEEWSSISPERRFHLLTVLESEKLLTQEQFEHLCIRLIDGFIHLNEGEEVSSLLSFLQVEKKIKIQKLIWNGERGEKLIHLGQESGFQEQSLIAIEKALLNYKKNKIAESIKYFATALQKSHISEREKEYQALSLKWIRYISKNHEFTDDLLKTLHSILREEVRKGVFYDLAWTALFYRDVKSFDNLVATMKKRSRNTRNLKLLRPFAQGEIHVGLTQLQALFKDSPRRGLKLMLKYLEFLKKEETSTQLQQHRVLLEFKKLLQQVLDFEDLPNSYRKKKIPETVQALSQILLGQNALLGRNTSLKDAHSSGAIFSGTLTAEPPMSLSWEFLAPRVPSPDWQEAFRITPWEYQSKSGKIVFGYRLEDDNTPKR